MREFKRKKLAHRIMYSSWMLFILFIALIFAIRAAWNVHQKEIASRESLDRSTRELDKLASREENLANSVAFLGTPKGVETEIRNKFRVAKDGEAVAVILEDSTSTVATTTSESRSVWRWMLHLFGIGE